MVAKKQKRGIWKAAKATGILLAVLGIIIVAYFSYGWSSFGSRAGTYMLRAYPQANGTFNQSGFNQTGTGVRFAARGMSPLNAYLDGIIIGILTLLLGIMALKYAGVKIATETKK